MSKVATKKAPKKKAKRKPVKKDTNGAAPRTPKHATAAKKKRSRSKPGQKRKPLSTVRQRKLKRRDKAATESEKKAKDEKTASSDHWDGGRTDQLLLRKALKKRWLTDMTSDQVGEVLQGGDVPLKSLAMAIVRKGMLIKFDKPIDEARVNQLAVSNLLRAEQQNQADEHKAQPDKVDLTVTESPSDRVASVLARLRGEIKRQAPKSNGMNRVKKL